MDVTHTEKITLEIPLKLASGQEISELLLRRPKYRDLKQVQRAYTDAADQQMALLTLVSKEKIVPEDLDDMDLADVMQVSRFFQRFMGDSQGSAGNGGASGQVVPVSTK